MILKISGGNWQVAPLVAGLFPVFPEGLFHSASSAHGQYIYDIHMTSLR